MPRPWHLIPTPLYVIHSCNIRNSRSNLFVFSITECYTHIITQLQTHEHTISNVRGWLDYHKVQTLIWYVNRMWQDEVHIILLVSKCISLFIPQTMNCNALWRMRHICIYVYHIIYIGCISIAIEFEFSLHYIKYLSQ